MGLLPDWPALWRHLRTLHAWIAAVGPDVAAVEFGCLALWCLAAWLAVGLIALGCKRLPGRCGRISVRITDLLVPAVVQRLLAGTAGLGLLLAPVTAGAEPAAPTGASATPIPAPSWPVNSLSTPVPAGPSGPATPRTVPAPRPTTLPQPLLPATPSTTSPVDRPSTDPPRTVRPKLPPTRGAETVLVRPRDSLWLIAARRLGPVASAEAVAGQWPRWYAANHTLIGGDPDLIYPGQLLRAPQSPA
jgi:hypothetical protein